jgi:hypothetical protein
VSIPSLPDEVPWGDYCRRTPMSPVVRRAGWRPPMPVHTGLHRSPVRNVEDGGPPGQTRPDNLASP